MAKVKNANFEGIKPNVPRFFRIGFRLERIPGRGFIPSKVAFCFFSIRFEMIILSRNHRLGTLIQKQVALRKKNLRRKIQFIIQFALKTICALKVDVERFELAVLQGAWQLLANDSTGLFIEHAPRMPPTPADDRRTINGRSTDDPTDDSKFFRRFRPQASTKKFSGTPRVAFCPIFSLLRPLAPQKTSKNPKSKNSENFAS